MPNDLEDAAIQHQFYLIQLGNFYGKKIDPILAKVRAIIAARLMEEGDTISTKKDLNAIQKDLKKAVGKEFTKYSSEIGAAVPGISRQEKEFYSESLEAGIKEKVKIETPKTAKIVAAALAVSMPIGPKGSGVTLGGMINDYAPRETSLVLNRVASGFSQGEPVSQIVTSINGTRRNKFQDGLLNLSRSHAFSMSGTMTPNIASTNQGLTDRLNRDVVIGYTLNAVLDSKTTDTCLFWDGTRIIYSETQQRPHSPFHYNCRTTETPITASNYTVSSSNTRRATGANGVQNISENTTAYDWLSTQPASFQDDVLGKAKGKVFRNAGLSTAEFRRASVRQNGASLTLEQMSSKNKKINSYLKK